MQYFQKLSGSAIKAAKEFNKMIAAATDSYLTPTSARKRPEQDFYENFRAACDIIDELASLERAGTAEADAMLFESKVKSHFKVMSLLLESESDRWMMEINSGIDTEVSEMPCFDTFLQYQMMAEICRRGIRDLPRGCLPLTLGTLASWIRTVKYPLLPHLSVHKHLARLISVACRFDALHLAESDSSAADQQELTAYKRRVETGLTALIGVIWRRIVDNPPILDFFTLFDTSRPTMTENGHLRPPEAIQMDVLTALVTLMGKPRVGVYAKEGLLVALSMRDERVDDFVLKHTLLLPSLVTELGRRFVAAIDYLVQPPQPAHSSLPRPNPSPGKPNPSHFASHQGPTLGHAAAVYDRQLQTQPPSIQLRPAPTPRQAEARPTALDAYSRAVRLVDAVTTASCSRATASISAGGRRAPSALTLALLAEFSRSFLLGLVQPAVAAYTVTQGETHSVAVTTLLRLLLEELSAHSLEGALLATTTAFLCGCSEGFGQDQPYKASALHTSSNEPCLDASAPSYSTSSSTLGGCAVDVPSLLTSRCLSMSITAPVAESALNLLSLTLAVAPLAHALRLCDHYDIKQLQSTPEVTSVAGAYVTVSTRLMRYQPSSSAIQTDLSLLLIAVQAQSSQVIQTPFDYDSTRLLSVAQYFKNTRQHGDSHSPDSLFDPVDHTTGRAYSVDQAYIHASLGAVLARLAGRVDEVRSLLKTLSSDSGDVEECGICDGAVLSVILTKLSCFQSLRPREQLAVSSLVHRYLCLLATAVVGVEGQTKRLDTLLLVLLIVEELWATTRAHVTGLTEFVSRYSTMRSAMMTTSSGWDETQTQSQGRAMDRHALQTAVVAREMLAETRGCVLAVQQLRIALPANSTAATTLVSENSSSHEQGTSYTTWKSGDECEVISEEAEDLTRCLDLQQRYGVELGPLATHKKPHQDSLVKSSSGGQSQAQHYETGGNCDESGDATVEQQFLAECSQVLGALEAALQSGATWADISGLGLSERDGSGSISELAHS